MSALIILGRMDGLMEIVLSNLRQADDGAALCSVSLNLQLTSKDVRRAVLAAGPFWVRVFQANYQVCIDRALPTETTVSRFERICALNPLPQEKCRFEFEACLAKAATDALAATEQTSPLDAVTLVERLCVLQPSLKRACPEVWQWLFAQLSSAVVRRNRLPEALAFVRRYAALNIKALQAKTHCLNLLMARFSRLMIHTLCVECRLDLNARCLLNGRTVLMEAVRLESVDAVEELVDGDFAPKQTKKRKHGSMCNPYGLDLSLRCHRGMTVFDYLDQCDTPLLYREMRELLDSLTPRQ